MKNCFRFLFSSWPSQSSLCFGLLESPLSELLRFFVLLFLFLFLSVATLQEEN